MATKLGRIAKRLISSRVIGLEAGQGLVEYAVIISLIALGVIVAFPGFKDALVALYNDIAPAFTP